MIWGFQFASAWRGRREYSGRMRKKPVSYSSSVMPRRSITLTMSFISRVFFLHGISRFEILGDDANFQHGTVGRFFEFRFAANR